MPATKAARVTCPICGSADIERHEGLRKIGDALTGFEQIKEFNFVCRRCGEDGDFANLNEQLYNDAMRELSKKAVARMMGQLSEQGHNNAQVERALNLPQRTAARWKKNGASAGAVALLKFVTTFPWLLEVAENRFEPAKAKATMAREATAILLDSAHAHGWMTVQEDPKAFGPSTKRPHS